MLKVNVGRGRGVTVVGRCDSREGCQQGGGGVLGLEKGTDCTVRSFHIKNYRPEWMTKELIEQIKDRDYFYKRAKSQGSEDAWNIAKHLRNVTNANIRQAKREFILNELQIHDSDPKRFWKVLHKVIPTNKQNLARDILLKDDDLKIGREDVAQFINNYFINVGNFSAPEGAPLRNKDTWPQVVEDLSSSDLCGFDEVLEKEVFDIVKNINVSKSSGLEDISSFIVKEAFKFLIPEITYMYNLSIRLSKFPTAWKQALVVPIPKSGNLTLVKNYRPISLLPLPGKILEKLVHQQLSTYMEKGSLLSNSQHGFRKGHSTIHSVAQLTSYISKKQDAKMPTLAAYIDFRKAFDCVQHPILLDKLANLGVGRSLINWVGSYLENRSQRVYANDTFSQFLKVTQGVPQGSVLGPLFYIIYANDLSKIVKNCEIALYADDTVLFTANKDFNKSVSRLQADLESLNVWCLDNGILANTDKTKVMVFGKPKVLENLPHFHIMLNKVPLQVVPSYKYLGISLDSQLSYNQHTTRIISSVTAKLKQFQRMRSFLNTKAALMVYKNMLLPILEYGDVFLSATSCINRRRLQILQNKGLRCALNRDLETSISDLHVEAKLLKLEYRREQHVLNYMYDLAQDTRLLKKKSAHGMQTRSCNKKILKVRRPKTEKFKKSFAYQGPKKWNLLPETFHCTQNKSSYKLLVSNLITERSKKASATLNSSIDPT